MSRNEEVVLFSLATLGFLTLATLIASFAGTFAPFAAMLLIDGAVAVFIGSYKITFIMYRCLVNWYIKHKVRDF